MAGVIEEVWDCSEIAQQYEFGNPLGKGAYGVVFVATHKPTGKQYAMKKMEMRVSEEGVPQSVLREISTLMVLGQRGHENIAHLHETFHDLNEDGTILKVFMVMEKCDWDLYTFLREIPRDMPDSQCRMIARQILRGVDFLHTNNVIHRDLKPQNILINRDQSVKIADFGLSRSYSMYSSFTTTVVTLWYRSPELLLQTSYNSGADIWAVGLIIAEVYSRRPLLNANTEAQQLQITMQRLGTPTHDQWPDGAIIDISQYQQYQRLPDNVLFPRMPRDGICLVNACLQFKASRRCSAIQALHLPYFQFAQPPPMIPQPLREWN